MSYTLKRHDITPMKRTKYCSATPLGQFKQKPSCHGMKKSPTSTHTNPNETTRASPFIRKKISTHSRIPTISPVILAAARLDAQTIKIAPMEKEEKERKGESSHHSGKASVYVKQPRLLTKKRGAEVATWQHNPSNPTSISRQSTFVGFDRDVLNTRPSANSCAGVAQFVEQHREQFEGEEDFLSPEHCNGQGEPKHAANEYPLCGVERAKVDAR
eukprot:TRINITY_DN4154_c0_g1_i2.p1 TRINITY_DN4154_c0_g1~~TRINITY_DN4154_c0_g1_i2.p1  ORF type:complete len:215 (-),score=32.12 TRINITY_DN4154_c0_g1_i2:10-654(-)